jgi:hypothetical protein
VERGKLARILSNRTIPFIKVNSCNSPDKSQGSSRLSISSLDSSPSAIKEEMTACNFIVLEDVSRIRESK